jgi:hypothetical protein
MSDENSAEEVIPRMGGLNQSKADASQPVDYVGAASWGVFWVSIFAWIACWALNSSVSESHWLIPLFLLPLLGQLIGSIVLFHRPRSEGKSKTFHRFYLAMMILCIGSYHGMWLCYSLWKLKSLPIAPRKLSLVALIAITVLVGLVVIMTLAIMCPPLKTESDHQSRMRRHFSRLVRHCMTILRNLKSGASLEPFLALLLFFTVFLGVSYLFGFAFAFHDKSLPSPEHALYMKSSYMGLSSHESKIQPSQSFRFQFDSLQAVPDIEQNPAELQSGAEIKKVAERKSENYKNLEAAVQYINKVNAEDALRITIIGHANDEPVAGAPYLSNYELAEARAQNLKHKMINRLAAEDGNRWRNIEWLCLSSSNELDAKRLQEIIDGSNKPPRRKRTQSSDDAERRKDDKRFAEVRIEQPWNQSTSVEMGRFESDRPKDISLMDYIYFANYTITTTGYGDIIPLTPYSKFICSLANICEVFFLVVFFNSLLSLKSVED